MVIWLQSVQRDGYDPDVWLALGDGIFRHVLPPSRNEGRPSPTRFHGGGLQGAREARRRLRGMVHGSLDLANTMRAPNHLISAMCLYLSISAIHIHTLFTHSHPFTL